MDEKKIIKANEIPYKELEKVGISEAAFLDLPKEALDRIMTGKLSPLLKMDMQLADGKKIPFAGKLMLDRDNNGIARVNVVFNKETMARDYAKAMGLSEDKVPLIKNYLEQQEQKLQNQVKVSPEDMKKLQQGDTLLTDVEINGGKEKRFVQLDKETNTIISAKPAEIKVPNAIGDVVLGEAQKSQFRQGNPIELEIGDTKVTVGVDLNDNTGCRVINGDLNEWKQKKLETWDRLTPGVSGYWRTSENGLQYESYKEEQKYGMSEEQHHAQQQEQEEARGYGRRR